MAKLKNIIIIIIITIFYSMLKTIFLSIFVETANIYKH